MEKKKIYIVLTDTGTILNRIIKLYTNKPYNHVSLSLDSQLIELYSFARKKYYNPLIGGFVKEDINNPILVKSKCAIYCLETDAGTYDKIISNIQKFNSNKNKYSYNILGLIGVILRKEFRRKNKYFCSQFVATILKDSGIELIPKKPCFTTPFDFAESEYLSFIYEGALSQYRV
ncbi:MAG: hypothetical protein PHS45_01410 [Bacilli bacterium]|nr:hypothetical protein [Bacilli bacterium]